MLNRKEKEELIIKLLEEDKTYKEISKEAHASFSEISKVNKELQGDFDESESASTRNQAYKMYLEGKRPIDIAIELQIDNVEATRYWTEYLELTKEYKVLEIRNELKDKFPQFTNLYMEMKKKHCRIDLVKKALDTVDNIETQTMHLFVLEADRRKYQEEVNQLEDDIKRLNSDKSVAEYELDCLESAKLLLCINIETLKQQKATIEEQPIRPFGAPRLDNEMTISNPDIILPSSGMGYQRYR
jgi:hypothetical protein